ncbi:MAG TPA: hypothetical protein VFQ50_12085, partial [Flavobacterium sp.]|nr:hypothetical protein [Flavobacterium sp.]
MKYFYTCLFLLIFIGVNAQVKIGSTNYNSLALAFHDINSGVKTGAITVEITGNTNELYIPTLIKSGDAWAQYGIANYTSVLIKPTGGGARTINMTGSQSISIKEAANVTIDGLNTGGNSLTFNSTNAVITLDATTNFTITKCTLLGSGTYVIGVTAGAETTTNTSITYNNISNSTGTVPYGIYLSGNRPMINTIITNNNISGFSFPEGSASGIELTGSAQGFTISSNRIFQSTPTSSNTTYGIRAVCNIYAGANLITNNTIGFANASGTGVCVNNGSFYGIYYSMTTDNVRSYINSNTISGIQSTNPYMATFTGIYAERGLVDINYNVIGSFLSNNAVTINNAAGNIRGIYLNKITNGGLEQTTISQNIVGG